jgi:hypothetical protein
MSSSSDWGDSVSDCGLLESTNFLRPSSPEPIPTNIIDCDITSTVCVTHILSIHPRKNVIVPTIQIITPQKAVPEVFPFSFENISENENLFFIHPRNKNYFPVYITKENTIKFNSNECQQSNNYYI